MALNRRALSGELKGGRLGASCLEHPWSDRETFSPIDRPLPGSEFFSGGNFVSQLKFTPVIRRLGPRGVTRRIVCYEISQLRRATESISASPGIEGGAGANAPVAAPNVGAVAGHEHHAAAGSPFHSRAANP
jgi:hypothetical protein